MQIRLRHDPLFHSKGFSLEQAASALAFGLAALAAIEITARPAAAQTVTILITVDERGSGTFLIGSTATPLTAGLAPDTGPGGLASALTYTLFSSPPVVAGDVFLTELGATSDIIRFNAGNSGGTVSPAKLVFYSTDIGGGDLADVGLPTSFYTNTISVPEIGGGAIYTPLPSQPGYVTGATATYRIISDAPEPSPAAIVGLGILGLTGLTVTARRRKIVPR